jgi:hypothetical protein
LTRKEIISCLVIGAALCGTAVVVGLMHGPMQEPAAVSLVRKADPILPDPKLTPGEVLPDATLEKVKQSGYSATTRDVDEAKKKAVFARYGIPWKRHDEFEVDHLIPASWGGSSNLANLWPQTFSGEWNAHVKDALEVHGLKMIRDGTWPLKGSQESIARDWIALYRKTFGDKPKEAMIRDEEQ